MKTSSQFNPSDNMYRVQFSFSRRELEELSLTWQFETIFKSKASQAQYLNFLQKLLRKREEYDRMAQGAHRRGDNIFRDFTDKFKYEPGGQFGFDPGYAEGSTAGPFTSENLNEAYRNFTRNKRWDAEPLGHKPRPEPAWCKVLGLPADATEAQIKSRYRTLAKQYHPDYGGDTAQFQKITKAYEEALQ